MTARGRQAEGDFERVIDEPLEGCEGADLEVRTRKLALIEKKTLPIVQHCAASAQQAHYQASGHTRYQTHSPSRCAPADHSTGP